MCFSDFFPYICVDLKDLDGGSEIRMGSDILFCVFLVGLYFSLLNCASMVVCWKIFEGYHPLFFFCLLFLEILETIQIYL
jgi:hypothetical protein